MIVQNAKEVSPLMAATGAEIAAGGVSVVKSDTTIDISQLKGLRYIRERGNRIEIGALTTPYTIGEVPAFKTALLGLWQAADAIDFWPGAQRGTLGGNLAMPFIGNMACILAALRGVVTLRNDTDFREVPIERLYGKNGKLRKEFDEWITKVSFPIPRGYYYAGCLGLGEVPDGLNRQGIMRSLLIETDEAMKIMNARAFTLTDHCLTRERGIEKELKGEILDFDLCKRYHRTNEDSLFGDSLEIAVSRIARQIEESCSEDEGPIFADENEERNYREFWADNG